jgi:hypothetical protein
LSKIVKKMAKRLAPLKEGNVVVFDGGQRAPRVEHAPGAGPQQTHGCESVFYAVSFDDF